MVGAAQDRLDEQIGAWQDERIIAMRGGHIVITDAPKLVLLA